MVTIPVIKDFDLNLIKVLHAVIHAGNAAKASKRLNISPSAVCMALQRLQKTYNEELFVRTKGGLVPTARAREIGHTFTQVLDMIEATLTPPQTDSILKEIVVYGSDFTEQYYFSRSADYDEFDRYLFHHKTSWERNINVSREFLVRGEADLLISIDPPKSAELRCVCLERFNDFSIICSTKHPLAGLEKMSLHHFYTFSHAVFNTNMTMSKFFQDRILISSAIPQSGFRRIGYRSESLSGLVSRVENSLLLAILPNKVAHYLKTRHKYAIEILDLPNELTIKPFSIHATWPVKHRLGHDIEFIVSTLRAISVFGK